MARHDNFRSGNKKSEHLKLPESQSNRSVGAAQLHFVEIQKGFADLRSLTNLSNAKIVHVPLVRVGITFVA